MTLSFTHQKNAYYKIVQMFIQVSFKTQNTVRSRIKKGNFYSVGLTSNVYLSVTLNTTASFGGRKPGGKLCPEAIRPLKNTNEKANLKAMILSAVIH